LIGCAFATFLLMIFRNRNHAGSLLAERIARKIDRLDCVYFLPRGGVEIAVPVALRFQCPICPVFVAKLRHPFQPELAIGAVDINGDVHVSETRDLALPSDAFDDSVRRARNSIEQLKQVYGSFVLDMEKGGASLLLVDDGLATGESARTALHYLRSFHPELLAFGVPCASDTGYQLIQTECDEVITVTSPDPDFSSVGDYYEDFSQVEHATVIALLERINLKPAAA